MEHITDKEYHVWFDSLEEANAELPAMILRQPYNASLVDTQVYGSRSGFEWFGTDGGARVLESLVRDGWPQQAEQLRTMAKELHAALDLSTVQAMIMDVRKRKRLHLDQGDSLDMHRVWNGDLDHAWERPVRIPRRAHSQRYATIYIDLAAHSGRRAREAVYRAAAAYKICDLFTAAGFHTEIWCGNSGRGCYDNRGPQRSWYGIRVKEYTQPLNEDRLAAMVSIGMLRTYGFRMIAAGNWMMNSFFGYPLDEGMPLPLRERAEKGERVVRIGECWSMHAAQQELAKVAQSLLPPKMEEAS